jgi:hypothetical protein
VLPRYQINSHMYIRSTIYYVCAMWKINKYSFFTGFNASILRHSGICGAAEEAVLNKKIGPRKSSIPHILSLHALRSLHSRIFGHISRVFPTPPPPPHPHPELRSTLSLHENVPKMDQFRANMSHICRKMYWSRACLT